MRTAFFFFLHLATYSIQSVLAYGAYGGHLNTSLHSGYTPLKNKRHNQSIDLHLIACMVDKGGVITVSGDIVT